MPANLSRESLLAILDEIRAGVATGDTLEGSIQFSLNYDDEPAAEHPWDVQAAYRIGNTQGQGGTRLIGHATPAPVDAEAARLEADRKAAELTIASRRVAGQAGAR